MATPKIELFTTDSPFNSHDVQYKGFIIVNKVYDFKKQQKSGHYCNLKNPFGFVESSYTQILFFRPKAAICSLTLGQVLRVW